MLLLLLYQTKFENDVLSKQKSPFILDVREYNKAEIKECLTERIYILVWIIFGIETNFFWGKVLFLIKL